jgi:hypothetical protein
VPAQAPWKTQLEPMLRQYVAPCFAAAAGHLRAKACWVTQQYADIKFAEGRGRGATFLQLFQATLGLLSDPDLPVRACKPVLAPSSGWNPTKCMLTRNCRPRCACLARGASFSQQLQDKEKAIPAASALRQLWNHRWQHLAGTCSFLGFGCFLQLC